MVLLLEVIVVDGVVGGVHVTAGGALSVLMYHGFGVQLDGKVLYW